MEPKSASLTPMESPNLDSAISATGMRRLLPRAARKGRDYSHLYTLAKDLITASDGCLSEENISDSLREAPSLTMADLWLFPLILRMALIETLAELAVRVSQAQQLRE